MNKTNYDIGQFCRVFRIVELDKTLKEVEGDENIKALSSFEHGKSSNISHLVKYIRACENKEQRLKFLNSLIKIL